jgi:TPR repeat protein
MNLAVRPWKVALILGLLALTPMTLQAGMTAEEVKAFEGYRDLAEKGDREAQFKLGVCYYEGDGVAKARVNAFSWYLKAAEQGLAKAQYNLANCFETGYGVATDKDQALSWYRKAAAQGYAPAQYRYGETLSVNPQKIRKMKDGGIAIDYSKEELADCWERKAAEQGYYLAQFGLGVKYQLHGDSRYVLGRPGPFATPDLSMAVSWYRKAAEQGYPRALISLGELFEEGQGVPKDEVEAYAHYNLAAIMFGRHGARSAYGEIAGSVRHSEMMTYETPLLLRTRVEQRMTKDEITAGQARTNALLALMDAKIAAFVNYKTLAEKGDREAQHSLANCYEKGDGVSSDRDQAFYWYSKAAEQGLAQAQNSVGNCYNSGEGVTKDQVQAVMWYRKAAEQGYARAQTNLGNSYANGGGVVEDKVQAVAWYRKAAEQGYAGAQHNLGYCFSEGEGVTKDPVQAFTWYRKAAEQGYDLAQHNLGICYANGEGVAKDQVQAVSWCRKAAEQGLAQAQHRLGVFYYRGDGVAKDLVQAVSWCRKAAEQGLAQAQLNLGVCYEEGDGVEKDEGTAVLWYLMAAEQGHAPALDRVGLCYATRKGVHTFDKDYDVEAYAYWSLVRMANETAIRERSPLWYVWTAKQGQTVDAKFCALKGDVITIQTREGRILDINAGLLIPSDVEHAKSCRLWFQKNIISVENLVILEQKMSRDIYKPGAIAAGQKRTMELQKEIDARIAAKKDAK